MLTNLPDPPKGLLLRGLFLLGTVYQRLPLRARERGRERGVLTKPQDALTQRKWSATSLLR